MTRRVTWPASFKPLAVGADTWGLGAVPPKPGDKVFYDHAILLKENGIYILETMNTGRLAQEGDRIHVRPRAGPLKGRGANGH